MKSFMFVLSITASRMASSALAARQRAWVDSFGKVWQLYAKPCEGMADTYCISGVRDPSSSLGCGALPIAGTETVTQTKKHVITLTVFSNSPKCSPSTWIAVYDPQVAMFRGNVVNALGQTVPFSFNPGLTKGSPEVSPRDPSRPAHQHP